jgi:hypothetical protein
MPSPLAIKRQLLRSSVVACNSLGYHAIGTEIVRPSSSSTVTLSSVTTTFLAVVGRISTAKVVIPVPQQILSVLLNKSVQPSDLGSTEATAALKPDRIKPELRNLVITFNMYVWGFIPIPCVEEESV